MQHRSFSRRSFLKLTGLSLGIGVASGAIVEPAMAADGSLELGPAAELRDAMLNLRVLVPDYAHQTLGEALVKGFAGTTPTTAWPMTLSIHPYQNAQSESVVNLLQESSRTPIVVVGGPLQVDEVAPLLRDAGRIAVVTGMGATIPRYNEDLASVVTAYWPHWQTEWALGVWAAQNLGRRAVIGTAAYESGYDSAYAFWAGFEYAGGTVVGHTVTHLTPASGLTSLVDLVKAQRPDVIYGAMSGVAANDLLGIWRTEWRAKGQRLLLNSAFLGMGGVTPSWAVGAIVAQPQLPQFMSKQPTRWSQVGVGLRQIFNAASQTLRGDFTTPDAVQRALSDAVATTGFATTTNIPATTIASIQAHRANIRLNQLAQTSVTTTVVEPLQAIQATNRTGWIGPYLS